MEHSSARIPLPLDQLFSKLKLPAGRTVEESIQDVTLTPHVIQDFRPLARSLEWELSDLYWAAEGLLPFVGNAVPFVINNSGRTSENAAATLFANCAEAHSLEDRIQVLELGAGTGLFARYFLDAFLTLCHQEGRDFYDRLTYFVSDSSLRTVEQWTERRLFSGHEEHVAVGTCDATQPGQFKSLNSKHIELENVRAVLINYVLDVLPSAIIRAGVEGPEQMCIRTHLTSHHTLLGRYSRLSMSEVRTAAASDDPAERAKLLPILTLLEFETAFLPVGDDAPPYLEEALTFGGDLERVVLNYGAMNSLEECLRTLHREGFVLINDYGPVHREQLAAHASVQRFGSSIALGINFPLLEYHFSKKGPTMLKPEGDAGRQIHARLMCQTHLPRTREAFHHRFSHVSFEYFEAPAEEARRHVTAGRYSEALESYRAALARAPRDWHLIGEVGEFVALQIRDFRAGLELIQAAIELNPYYSTWLWNVLGDCLFCLERYGDAHEAYLQAQRINPDDVRTNFNLSYTYLRLGSYREALGAVSRGLANDALGTYRDRLLNKQQEILAAISERWIGEQERLLKRDTIFG